MSGATCLLAVPSGALAADSCANAAFRTGVGANLPDCRAYEQVTPVDKNGNGISPRTATLTNLAGDRVFFQGPGAVVGTDGAPQDRGFGASRSAAGWSTVSSDPVAAPPASFLIKTTAGVTDNGAKAIVISLEALAPGASEGDSNLYLRDLEGDRGFRHIATASGPDWYQEMTQGPGNFVDATPDGSAVAFQTASQVLDDVPATGEHRLYVWRDGEVTLASRRPRTDPNTPGDIAAVNPDFITGPARSYRLTDDGSAVTWFPTTRDAFYRTTGDGITVDMTRSRRAGGPAPQVPAINPFSTPDGSQVFFRVDLPLTDDSLPVGAAIYRYTPATDDLEDLTYTIAPQALNRNFEVRFVSPDGALVWFTSGGALTPGTSSGREHLYVLDVASREVTLAAEFDPDPGQQQVGTEGRDYRWSPDGRSVAFITISPLTGDTASTRSPVCRLRDTNQANGFCPQVFSFDADDAGAGPVCVSCGSGQAVGSAEFGLNSTTSLSGREGRGILDDGRVFFTTARRLVPADTDSVTDVYQFVPGAGPQLLTAGNSGSRAVFGDASADGRNVFIITAQQLVPGDADDLDDVYTARVGGGLASQQVKPPAPAPGCSGEACRPENTVTPPRPVPGTPAFTPLNVVQPRFSFSRPSARTLRSAGRSGRLTLPVRVTLPGRVTATLTGRLSGRKSSRAGSAAVRTTKAGTVRLTVRLSKRARDVLKRRGTLKLRLTVRYSRQDRVASTVLTFTTGRAATSNQGGAR